MLRAEIARVCGEPLPDVPLLDTIGKLRALVGLRTVGVPSSLRQLLDDLHLANLEPHNALADATATANAAHELLRRAEAAGHSDLTHLLADCGDLRTGTVTAATPRPTSRLRGQLVVFRPPEHQAAHADPDTPVADLAAE